MLTITDSTPPEGPKPTRKRTKTPPAPAAPLRLTVGEADDSVKQVTAALEQTQRRLDNLRDLIDRFDLDDDDGPRAA
ncbi:MAG: hypothetical protein RIE77_04360 [Phycisphaerales bacterium]|jgi:hypothetical protein